jgi:hypothetical protein
MAITNQNKAKDPTLEEIEKDDTPIDDKGNPVAPIEEPKVEDLLAKDPEELTATDLDILSAHKTDLTEEQLIKVGLLDATTEPEPIVEPTKEPEIVPEPKVEPVVVPEPVVTPPAPVTEPTEEDLRKFVLSEGSDWDELTNFEKAMAKKNFVNERDLKAIQDSFKNQQKASEWSNKIKTFIDSTNNDPKYTQLSGHEQEFAQFATKFPDSDIETLLLPAFLHTLPATPRKRGSLFEHGGGGDKIEKPKEGIVDAEMVSKLRVENPREYKRLLKAGKIKLELD